MALYINAQNLFIEGRSHVVTLDNKVDSIVTKKLRSEKPGLHFFWTKNCFVVKAVKVYETHIS